MAKSTMFERSRTRVRFSNEDMDYLLQLVLGYHTYGGASFGEIFRAAAKVDDGEPESWIDAFRKMGERIEEHARGLEERGKPSAVPAFLRAFTGYRAAFLMNPKTDFERFSETVESFVTADCADIDPHTPCMHNRLGDSWVKSFVRKHHAVRVKCTEIRCQKFIFTIQHNTPRKLGEVCHCDIAGPRFDHEM